MTSFNLKRAWAMAMKEVAHVSRDPFTIALALGLPVIVVFIFGLAIEFNLKDIATAVYDSDRSASSRMLTETFGSSGYFLLSRTGSASEGLDAVSGDRARAVLVIPPQFEKKVNSGVADVQVIIDGSDGSVVSSILAYLGQIQARFMAKLTGQVAPNPLQLKTRFLFNPELNTKWFIVPGLTVVILAILSVLLTALTVAREWENGSMELLLSTPVQPLEIIFGKLGPYAGLGLISVGIVYVLARVFFDVPFVGSHVVFGLGCTLFLTTCLAQGLLISIATRTQTLAMQIAMLSGLLPTILLSGFIFQTENIPPFFQYLTMILPARWFMVIARDSFLQGSTLLDLQVPFFALSLTTCFFIVLSVKRFKKDLEP